MKIGIDLIPITGKEGGLQRMGQQLIEGLVKFDDGNEYNIFINKKSRSLFSIKKKNFNIIEVKTPPKIHYFYEQFYILFRSIFEDLDILHSPVSAPPYFSFKKSVITLPDLTFILFPETMSKFSFFYWSFFMSKGIKNAKRIIAISESTKRDLVKYFHIPEDKIKVIYPYLDKYFKHDERYINFLKEKYNIYSKYILYVGTLEPRKNITSLIKAFAKVKKDSSLNHLLVIAGKKGWLFDNIFTLVKELNLESSIIFTGFIPEQYLPSLYSGADLFVYPSLYEGFGLPPLEAMACGTPVIVSNSSSLPEVVGDAGILVNPYNINEISEKILQVLKDKYLRIELSQKGLQRVKKFSIKKSIDAIISIYKEVVTLR